MILRDNFFEKVPNEKRDYTIDWSTWLVAGDTINACAWTIPTGLTSSSPNNTTTAATIWLTGGTAGETYTVTNKITTLAGRIGERVIMIFVREKR